MPFVWEATPLCIFFRPFDRKGIEDLMKLRISLTNVIKEVSFVIFCLGPSCI